MKFISTILISIVFLSPEEMAAQNYFYINGDITTKEKINIKSQIEYATMLFDMQDVTIAVFKCELPGNFNATIEYQPNHQNNRKMILIRLSSKLVAKDYMQIISHEMIHAYQYYTGDLVRQGRTIFTWRGDNFKNVHQMEHAKRPWEMEAIDLANALTDSYIYFQNNYNILSKGLSFEMYKLRN